MKVIIIDDEVPSITLLKLIISKNNYLEIIGEYTDPKDALSGIKKLVPDVIFVDIEMPQMNGMELASEVMNFNINIQIVFITAYEQYALKAFHVNAVNYILKPITEEALQITVSRLLRNYNIMKQVFLQNNETNRILVLGNNTVFGNENGRKVQWATAKSKELFGFFILEKGKEVDKWRLCDALYPDASSKNAEHSLHSTISRSKAALKEAGIENIIYCNKGKYEIDMKGFTCDLWEWKDFMEQNPVITMENVTHYERIIGLYSGELFGVDDYIWVLSEKEKINKQYLNSLKKIATYFVKQKKYHKAEHYLEKYIEREPYDESISELLIRVYYFSGKKLEMVRLYNNLEIILDEELGVTPRESLSNLYRDLLIKL